MRVRDIMTANPQCCTSETGLQDVAKMMVDCDCGEIPVVSSLEGMIPVGVITDRDITCRSVARGRNPLEMKTRDCMTSPAVTMTPESDVHDCCELMEARQLRRVLVVDGNGRLCGIVSQADIALNAPSKETAEVVKEVSTPADA